MGSRNRQSRFLPQVQDPDYLFILQTVQLLIERGCQYSARNNLGFTASDYAYSFVEFLLDNGSQSNPYILI